MIKLGKVQGNKMVDMQLNNNKLVERGSRIVAQKTGLDINLAKEYLLKHGSVRDAVKAYPNRILILEKLMITEVGKTMTDDI